jgi:hypothetical protein
VQGLGVLCSGEGTTVDWAGDTHDTLQVQSGTAAPTTQAINACLCLRNPTYTVPVCTCSQCTSSLADPSTMCRWSLQLERRVGRTSDPERFAAARQVLQRGLQSNPDSACLAQVRGLGMAAHG